MENTEKFIDKELTYYIVEMLASKDRESHILVAGIIDNILESDTNTNDLVDELSKMYEDDAFNEICILENEYGKTVGNPNYLKLCFAHTKATMLANGWKPSDIDKTINDL